MTPRRTDEERLRLFSERVDKAVSRRAVAERTLRAQFSLKFGENKTSITQDHGDDEDRRSLLMDLRMFLSEKEDVFYFRIAKILDRRLTDDELRAANATNREQWQAALRGAGGYSLNGKVFMASDFFDLVVNGEMFHLDPEKADEYARFDPITRTFADHAVASLAVSCVKVLHYQRNLVNKALAEGLLDLS